MSIQKVQTYLLACGHIVMLKIEPELGDLIWCSRCEKYPVITDKAFDERTHNIL